MIECFDGNEIFGVFSEFMQFITFWGDSHLNRDEIMKYGVTEIGNMFLMTVLIYPQVFMAFGMGLNEFHVFPDCKTLFWKS